MYCILTLICKQGNFVRFVRTTLSQKNFEGVQSFHVLNSKEIKIWDSILPNFIHCKQFDPVKSILK